MSYLSLILILGKLLGLKLLLGVEGTFLPDLLFAPFVLFGKRVNGVLLLLVKPFRKLFELVLHVAVTLDDPIFKRFGHLTLHLRLDPA